MPLTLHTPQVSLSPGPDTRKLPPPPVATAPTCSLLLTPVSHCLSQFLEPYPSDIDLHFMFLASDNMQLSLETKKLRSPSAPLATSGVTSRAGGLGLVRGSSCEAGKDLEYSQASHWAASLGDTVPLFSLSVRNMELLNENFRKKIYFIICGYMH